MAEPEATKQTFKGSCHCGKIRYAAALALSKPPVAQRCNCTMCLKQGYTTIRITADDFTLISPENKAQVQNYKMKSNSNNNINKYFCGTCGIHCWSEGEFEFQGVKYPLFTINILTLDQPQEGLELSDFKIMYSDGRNDNWAAGSRDTPWPGGCI
ncbi:hypothetical protein PV10_02993 [Exophiala mesophila]|uniref:CENP-V/GFA domain-containing protein n=1 Tax=Exophiala mesophila TaxID=212818 RepID=A0A0D2A8L5_EXOME|nr:uncharacterized protein PV10_02993 [Exophiala mesophila]KIV95323.1 hypothetical protein PV10_02993 [Exophiala mesophila]